MLVPLNDLKTFLGISLVDTTYDAFLNEQGQIVSDAIEAYCRRKFIQANYTQTFYYDELSENARPMRRLTLFYFPLTAISEIRADGVAIAGAEYRFVADGIAVLNERRDWRSIFSDKLEVDFTAGTVDVPTPVKDVIYNIMAERYNKKKSNISLNFGSDVQMIAIPGVMSIDFDYSLQTNERKRAFGMILGNNANVLDYYRSERAIVGTVELSYVS